MAALNFLKKYAPAVEAGTKRQTIRAQRKRPIRVNDKLFLYTGMRNSNCRKLAETIAQSVEHIVIDTDGVVVGSDPLTTREIFELAQADGFKNKDDFMRYFRHSDQGLPFIGQLIKW